MNIISKLFVAFIVTIAFSVNVKAQKNFSADADIAFNNKQYFNAIVVRDTFQMPLHLPGCF